MKQEEILKLEQEFGIVLASSTEVKLIQEVWKLRSCL